jgi:hypothetical protein
MIWSWRGGFGGGRREWARTALQFVTRGDPVDGAGQAMKVDGSDARLEELNAEAAAQRAGVAQTLVEFLRA